MKLLLVPIVFLIGACASIPQLTPGTVQSAVQASVAAASNKLQGNPTELANFKIGSHIAGQLIISLVNQSSLPTSADLQALLASKLSSVNAATSANVEAIVALAYDMVYSKFSGDVAKAAPWLTAIGTPLASA